ncbi:MAG: PAS domain-containing protein [Chloroflexota bacterium]
MTEPTAKQPIAPPAAAHRPAPPVQPADAAVRGLLAAASALCGGDAWLVRRGPEGGLTLVARSRDDGSAAPPPAVAEALAGACGPGAFQVSGHADGGVALAGAATADPRGGLIAVAGETTPGQVPAPPVLRALEGLADAAAALAATGETGPGLPDGGHVLQAVIDAVPDHIWIKDPAGRYLAVNRAAAAMLGLDSPAQAIGRTARELRPSPGSEVIEEEDAAVLAYGEPIRGILRQGIITGDQRWWFSNKMPLLDASGRVAALVGISRDVTELETARADLARERDRLQQILDAIPDAVFVKDREGRIVLFNPPAAERLAPALGERVLGAHISDYYSGERLRRAREEDRRVMETGRPLLNQVHHAADGDRERWTLVSKAPLLGPGKVVEGIVGVSRDITPLQRAERLLAAERDQLQAILDALPVSVYLKDAAHRYIRINRTAAERLGLADPADAIGKTSADLWDAATADRIRDEERDLLASGEDEVEGIDFQPRPDGRETVVLYAKRLVRDAEGNPAGFIGTDRDITTIFALQRDLAVTRAARDEASRKADRLTAAKGGMLAMLTHEFRTPLTAIHGYADMIRDYDLDREAIRDYAGEISRASSRLADLTEDMLELDRLQSGGDTLDLAPVPLLPIITEVTDLLAGASLNHQVRVALPPDLPPALGNPAALRRILTNLIGNAIKYSPDGGQVVIEAVDPGDGFLDLSVHDHGLGIPEEDLRRIFEPYVRLAEGKRRGINGTGLGLPIVRELVRAQRGEVWAENAPDGGSIFRLLLPAAGPGRCPAGRVRAAPGPRDDPPNGPDARL